MKKTYIYMVLAAAAVAVAVLAVSCVRELDIPRPEIGDNAVITLTPFCDDPVTKAEEPGDDTYNENLIADYYWFIYSDEAGSTLLKSGYTSGNGVTEIPLSDFPITSGNGWVYVIANLPQEPKSPVAGDEWFEYDEATGGLKRVVQGGSTTAYAGTVTGETGLLTIDFGKSMPTSYTKSSEFYEYTSATTGVPKPEKFVMRTSTPVNFTIVNNTTNVEVPAHLERVAVKIILDLYVAESVIQKATTTDGSESYVKSWDSDISHIQIYMLWGSTRGNLAGTPYHYGDAGVSTSWFYSASPRYAMYTNPLGGRYDNATNSVAGSVPDNRYVETDYPVMTTVWDYVYVVNESQGDQGWLWDNDKVPADADDDWRDIHRGDYYYGNWAYIYDENNQKQIRTYIDEDDGQTKLERQSTTQTEIKTYYKISSLPLYTMPISWNVNEAHAPFIKVILPWQGYYGQAVDGHAVGERDPKTTEFYYKILIPELTTLDANGCYHIKLDLSVLGSTADEVPVELSGQYYVVAWNAPQMMGGDQSAGRYLDCSTHFEFYSQNEMNIPVRSSHDIEIVGTPTATFNNYAANTVSTGNLTYRTNVADTTGNYFTVTPTGNSNVTVYHVLQPNLTQMQARDVAPITYTFTIQHKGDGGSAYKKTITVVQYPSMYIDAIPDTDNGERFYSSYYGYMYNGNVYINNQIYAMPSNYSNNDAWRYVIGLAQNEIGTQGNNNPNKYRITSSVLDPSLGFVLGDPRTDAINNLNYTFATAPSIEGTNRSLQYYYPTEHNSSNESSSRTYNMVAPSFINASSFGKCGPAMTYDQAVRRCAAYQEDGYPAGRWRLPTRAELQYIATMSAKGLIPRLYNDTAYGENSIYWSAHGLKTITNGVVNDNNGTSGFVRCVYDDWYWGKDRAVNVTTFTWGDKQR